MPRFEPRSGRVWLGLLLAGGAAPIAAQQAPTCTAAEFRQFDFWVGEWTVMSGANVAGTNSVTLEESGCVVHEHWTGSRGGTGQSFNFYDRQDGKWHQVWIDNSGSVLWLTGTYAEGKLSYSGETRAPNGARTLHRLTFTRNADGTVRQFWESSGDEGKTWTVAFDGLYRHSKP